MAGITKAGTRPAGEHIRINVQLGRSLSALGALIPIARAVARLCSDKKQGERVSVEDGDKAVIRLCEGCGDAGYVKVNGGVFQMGEGILPDERK
ncbi:hypothetical protein [Pectobacterium sp. B1J-3]|uniref:hypothetical protein n=1 Tax=Pectobacterium sp. B1J-3 TaxID=3385371 RepID=UPI00390694E8